MAQVQFPDGEWGSPEELAAYNNYNAVMARPHSQKEEADALGQMRGTAAAGYDKSGDGKLNGDVESHSPGAADVGGAAGMGELYRQAALDQMSNNDHEQASNDAAMNNSLANMRSNRGTVVPEDATFVAREAAARAQQGQALDLDRNAAEGNAPSAANYQTQIGMNDIMSGQAGAAGSARGLNALNGVQGAGAQTAGLSAGNLSMSGGMARSKEMGDALGMYGSTAGDMRSGDLNRMGQNYQNVGFNADLNDAWKIGNANLAAKQGMLGVQMGQTDQDAYTASMHPASKQLEYDQEINALKAGADAGSAGAAIARGRDENERNKSLVKGGIAAGAAAVGSLGGPAGTAAGGVVGGMAGSAVDHYR